MSIVAQYYAEALMKTAALAIYIYGTDKHIVLLFCIHLHFSQYNTFINIFPNLLLRMVRKTLAKYVDALTETSYKIIGKNRKSGQIISEFLEHKHESLGSFFY